jgi:hypothetical protein
MSGSYLSEKQVSTLLQPIHPRRVTQRNDNGMSHVEGYDIRAELNRVFGFGRWDMEVVDQVLLREEQVKTSKGGNGWNVVYRSRVRLTVKSPDGTPLSVQEATHVGENTHPSFGESHGNAVTNSETYALRRCAINFGDQFGLSLYNKGSQAATVRWTLVHPDSEKPVDTDDVPEVNPEHDGSEQTAARPAADLTGWKIRVKAATDGSALDKILADMELMRGNDELGTEDAARIRSLTAARAAEFDRDARKPEADATADGDWVARFKARIPAAGPDHMRPMKVEVMRAVSSKAITTDAGNELLALLKERATALEGAENVAA